MKAKGGRQKAEGGRVCLCAEISFDGKLLNTAPQPEREPLPKWWLRLLARKHSVPAQATIVRDLLEAGRADELCLRVRPCVDGRSGQPSLSGPGGKPVFFERSIIWELVRMGTTAEGDCLLHYQRANA